MRLPRRVPWATLAELDQVCNLIYADEADIDARIKALNRLSAWRAITPLPHALEAVLSVLSSVILDDQCYTEQQQQQRSNDRQSSVSTPRSSLALSVRQSYATAIVRLVNGLVDPLQLGTYARSIASIAAQIGLPQWLVELRHAATHEDLPSLELLRTGARESLAWLLHNYFLPTLSASNVEQSTPTVHLSPLSPLLKQYKSLMKIVSRDASLKMQYKDELTKALRGVERWVGEARVASSAVIFSGWGAGELGDGEDENERWAIDRLCEALLERDGLVPVSSKKRLASNSKSSPILPASLIAIWSPLLSALKANHPSLPSVLVSAITDSLICRPSTRSRDESSKKDLSYELCLAAWVAWCVDQWDTTSSDVQAESASLLRREEVVIGLVLALGIRADESTEPKKGANVLLGLLVHSYPALEDISTSLISAAQRDVHMASKDSWTDDEMFVMEERLNILLSSVPSASTAEDARGTSSLMDIDRSLSAEYHVPPKSQQDDMPRGWTKIPTNSWKACPIGVFVG